MNNDAKVRIQVDDSRIRELRKGAAELYESFAKNAKEQHNSIREINKSIEEQIRLLETRNQKQNTLRRQELEAEYREGAITPREYRVNLRNVESSREAVTAQIGNLREMFHGDSELKQRERAESLYERFLQRSVRGRESFGGVEEQIRQFERHGELEQSVKAFRLRSQFNQGLLNRGEYNRGLRSLSGDQQENKLLIRLLKEIADNTKNSAKESAEALVKRLNISSASEASDWIKRLEEKESGTDFDILRRRHAAEILRNQYGGGASGGGQQGLGINMLMSRRGIRGLLSKLGPIGLGLSAIAGTAVWGFNRYSDRVERGRDIAVVSGGSLRDIWDKSVNRGRAGSMAIGLKGDEYVDRMAAYQRASGRIYSPEGVISNFAQQRALGIDNSQYDTLLNLGRFSKNGTAQGAASSFANYVNKRYGNLALLPEILNTFQGAAQNILSVRGDFDQNALAGIIQNIGARTGAQGGQLDRIIGGLQGIGSNSNPLATSLAYRAALTVNPNATTWEAGKMIENPLGNTEFLKQYLQQIQQTTGGGDRAKFLAKSLLGLSSDDIDRLFGAKGDRDFDSVLKGINTSRSGDYRDRASQLTTARETLGASWDQIQDDFIAAVQSVATTVSQTVKEMQENNLRYLEKMNEVQAVNQKVLYSIMAFGPGMK